MRLKFNMILSKYNTILLFLWFLLPGKSEILSCQNVKNDLYADTLIKTRIVPIVSGAVVAYTGSIIGLSSLWYKDYPRSDFHFINDNKEWLQMDKVGHAATAYSIGRVGYESLRWSGLGEKKSLWFGGLSGIVFLTTVEVLDGYSAQWGASSGDLLANTFGAALFIGQQLAWHQQKVQLKWSFHKSPFAKYNPNQLGTSFAERMLKDYNGQTYWLSANITSFGLQESGIPKWLNVALGYGAEGMTGAYSNSGNMQGISVPESERRRQIYISPDIDLSKIKVKSKTLHWLLTSLGFIKIPMPALLFEKDKVRVLPIYF